MKIVGSEIDLSANDSLAGQLLVAMPQMTDPRFDKTVIYMCAHDEEGAMGLVLNKLVDSLTFSDMLSQLKIENGPCACDVDVHFGGPVESGRGFVLHTDDYQRDGTMFVINGIALTATIDVLKSISQGDGPRRSMLALGYAGWGPGQLESEIQSNGWLHVAPDESLIFDRSHDAKWNQAIAKLGIDPGLFAGHAGRA